MHQLKKKYIPQVGAKITTAGGGGADYLLLPLRVLPTLGRVSWQTLQLEEVELTTFSSL